MSSHEIVASSLELIGAHYRACKLLVIHPASRYRKLLIAALINTPPCPLAYYQLGVTDTGLPQLLFGLSQALSEQVPLFGRHLCWAQASTPRDPQALAAALADDLAELSPVDYLLVLDDYDRPGDVPDIHSFLERLLAALPPHCHLLLNGRTIPRLPWPALVARHQAAMICDAHILSTGFYPE